MITMQRALIQLIAVHGTRPELVLIDAVPLKLPWLWKARRGQDLTTDLPESSLQINNPQALALQVNEVQVIRKANKQDLEPILEDPWHKVIAFYFGEERSIAIAGASIVAKVTRDRMMRQASGAFPAYALGQHKGYATPEHKRNIQLAGASIIHRLSFRADLYQNGDALPKSGQISGELEEQISLF